MHAPLLAALSLISLSFCPLIVTHSTGRAAVAVIQHLISKGTVSPEAQQMKKREVELRLELRDERTEAVGRSAAAGR